MLSQQRPALRVVRLETGDWSDSWEDKPSVAVAVGLRLVSDDEESFARRKAADLGADVHGLLPSVDAYNDALVSCIVGAAMCSPNDISSEPECLPLPVETVRNALTSRAIRRLYHELDSLMSEASPAARHIEDDELVTLVEMIAEEPEKLSNRARRLLAAVFDDLND
jgi:hypothetical protein